MFDAVPIWLLPLWTICIPLAWAIYDLASMPKADRRHVPMDDSPDLPERPLGVERSFAGV